MNRQTAPPIAPTRDGCSAPIEWIFLLMIQSAAKLGPEELCQRLEEEWLADLLELRRGAARLSFALGCYWAALIIKLDGYTLRNSASNSFPAARAIAGFPRHGPPLPARRTIATAGGTVICDINTTPLIDVMLVLLVTLIVSLPLMTHAVILDLPRIPPSSDQIQPEVIDLDIDFDGTVVWNGTALASWQQLESHLHEEAQKTSQPEIHLRPDRRVKYDVVAKVLAAAQRNRMQKIGLANTAEFKE